MNYILIIILAFFIDYFSKFFVNRKIAPYQKKQILGDFLVFMHVKNCGAMLGFLKNKKYLLNVLTVLIIVIISIHFVYSIFNDESNTYIISLALFIAGALGNFVERITKGSVTDFIYFKIKFFPIFNFADVFIFSGLTLYCIEIIQL